MGRTTFYSLCRKPCPRTLFTAEGNTFGEGPTEGSAKVDGVPLHLSYELSGLHVVVDGTEILVGEPSSGHRDI